MTRPERGKLDARGLRAAPSQVLGAVRLVPLERAPELMAYEGERGVVREALSRLAAGYGPGGEKQFP